MNELKQQNKSLARVNIKMNNYSLLDEKLTNKMKQNKAKRIVDMIEKF